MTIGEQAAFGELVEAARAAPPRIGSLRVIAVDGQSGSGKTTLASRLAHELDAPLVPIEPLYDGWDGLERGVELLVTRVLAPLAAGRTAQVPRWDWNEHRWAEGYSLEPPPLLVVEGVGAGARIVWPYVSLLVWLELGEQARKQRALARDGETFRPFWDEWAVQERVMLERERTPERADVVLDTSVEGCPSRMRVTACPGRPNRA